jgi:hypothetical protein
MRHWITLAVIAMALALAACAEPVPQSRLAYVGKWTGPGMTFEIAADGTVAYWHIRDKKTVHLEAPLRQFIGDNFEVGFGPMTTTFVVSQPPHEEDGQWKMVVDGVELVKAAK